MSAEPRDISLDLLEGYDALCRDAGEIGRESFLAHARSGR